MKKVFVLVSLFICFDLFSVEPNCFFMKRGSQKILNRIFTSTWEDCLKKGDQELSKNGEVIGAKSLI